MSTNVEMLDGVACTLEEAAKEGIQLPAWQLLAIAELLYRIAEELR